MTDGWAMEKWQVLIVVFFLFVVVAAFYLIYFAFLGHISRYDIVHIGHCFCSDEIGAILDSYLNSGPFERSLARLKHRLLELGKLRSVELKPSFNGTLNVIVVNDDPDFLLTCGQQRWEVRRGRLTRLDASDAEFKYSIEITPEHLANLQAFGLNQEFFETLESLKPLLDNKSLKITVKYDNNMSGNLGWMVVYLPQCNADLSVKEKVSAKRLETALKLMVAQTSADEGHRSFDLYSNALVKRN